MANKTPIIPTRRVMDRLTLIRAHTKALRRRLRGGSEAERGVVTGHLDAIDRELDAVAVLVQELRDKKESKPTS